MKLKSRVLGVLGENNLLFVPFNKEQIKTKSEYIEIF